MGQQQTAIGATARNILQIMDILNTRFGQTHALIEPVQSNHQMEFIADVLLPENSAVPSVGSCAKLFAAYRCGVRPGNRHGITTI